MSKNVCLILGFTLAIFAALALGVTIYHLTLIHTVFMVMLVLSGVFINMGADKGEKKTQSTNEDA
ncbi:hypothetical protein [Halobacillus litoralis]|uniref:hypothetical protein n=1 Tax=Halobacillus litoralis TaxID=45668 RepID=UPI001CD25323|nr:hypothetical protein [Halobacillus litoralis]MCA1021565.1 hypothetical protein [Halobacillus litoralis]